MLNSYDNIIIKNKENNMGRQWNINFSNKRVQL